MKIVPIRIRVLTLPLLIVALAALATAFAAVDRVSADEPFANTRAVPVEEALRDAPFQVARPGYLPFDAVGSFGMRDVSVAGRPRIEQTYVGTSGYVSITATPGPLLLESKRFTVKRVELPDGSSGQFVDNGVVQVLVWTRGGVSYHMAASRNGHVYDVSDLIEIASEMR